MAEPGNLDKLEVLNFLLLALIRHLVSEAPDLQERIARYLDELASVAQDESERRNAKAAAQVMRAFPQRSPSNFRPH